MYRVRLHSWIVLLGAMFVALFLLPGQACAQPASPAQHAASVSRSSGAEAGSGYKLGSGDKLHMNVFGQKDLNGDYVVDGGGNVQLPLIGEIHAAGKTVGEFQREVTAKLADGFLVNPNVTIEVTNYRPFYIMGEINKPGEYPYVNGMSVLNAVALAGGFTVRADDSEVYIRRNGADKEKQYPADETTKVYPGDIIRVPERFF